MSDKRFVYILRSDIDANRHYVGITSDVEERLHWHNHGPSGVTIPHRPWSLVVVLEFADRKVAGRFERYLKTGSGVRQAALWRAMNDRAGRYLVASPRPLRRA